MNTPERTSQLMLGARITSPPLLARLFLPSESGHTSRLVQSLPDCPRHDSRFRPWNVSQRLDARFPRSSVLIFPISRRASEYTTRRLSNTRHRYIQSARPKKAGRTCATSGRNPRLSAFIRGSVLLCLFAFIRGSALYSLCLCGVIFIRRDREFTEHSDKCARG